MKMVKSLLLGSAAGIVAIAGAQAADLPVKAKPVQYVKICSLYGVGFYYIPGTDVCIKVGGFVRAEINVNTAGGSFAQYNQVNFDNRGTNWTHTAYPRWHQRGCACGYSLRDRACLREHGADRDRCLAGHRHCDLVQPRLHPVGRLHLR